MKRKHFVKLFATFTPTRIIVLGFLFIIILGALLLSTPLATRSGESTNFLDAFFTATSSTCVTGLIVFDTYTHWSAFGQVVIICLIQIGGIGFMTMATLFFFVFRKQISFKQRLLTAKSFNQESIEGIVKLTRRVIFGTFIIEAVGAVILSIRFSAYYGVKKGIVRGVFHSISSFCNAGIDILGDKTPYGSLIMFNSDVVILTTIMALIVIGGIGFSVWGDITRKHMRKNDFSLHTKIVFFVTGALLLVGFIGFFAFEYNNKATIGNMSFIDKVLNAMFQSVTTRTAGYASINQNALYDHSKFLSIILMIIGGSPGSTAGGIKTVTLGVIIITGVSILRGLEDVNVFFRKLPISLILQCLLILMMAVAIIVTGTMIICIFEDFSFIDILFEVASAFGTVGLTAGITSKLSGISKIVLIIIMYTGRVGILTIGWALALRADRLQTSKIKYPEGKISVG